MRGGGEEGAGAIARQLGVTASRLGRVTLAGGCGVGGWAPDTAAATQLHRVAMLGLSRAAQEASCGARVLAGFGWLPSWQTHPPLPPSLTPMACPRQPGPGWPATWQRLLSLSPLPSLACLLFPTLPDP